MAEVNNQDESLVGESVAETFGMLRSFNQAQLVDDSKRQQQWFPGNHYFSNINKQFLYVFVCFGLLANQVCSSPPGMGKLETCQNQPQPPPSNNFDQIQLVLANRVKLVMNLGFPQFFENFPKVPRKLLDDQPVSVRRSVPLAALWVELWRAQPCPKAVCVCLYIHIIYIYTHIYIYITGWWFQTFLFSISYMGCHPSH